MFNAQCILSLRYSFHAHNFLYQVTSIDNLFSRHLENFDFENLTFKVYRNGACQGHLPTIRGDVRFIGTLCDALVYSTCIYVS